MQLRTWTLAGVAGALALGFACGDPPRTEVGADDVFVINEVTNVQRFLVNMRLEDTLSSVANPRLEVEIEISQADEGAAGILVIEQDGEDVNRLDLPEVSSVLSLGDVLRCGSPPCTDQRGLRFVLTEAGNIDGFVAVTLSAAEGSGLTVELVNESAL